MDHKKAIKEQFEMYYLIFSENKTKSLYLLCSKRQYYGKIGKATFFRNLRGV
ncbi:hypothetical protein RV15_GL001301 [Enterococcus silesiacus]|uniref:Uncharacterized protein n=1 Tax=Enterococcus silesiacus TaxID=332949 RepID=A0AA91JQT1_9ENTE|nr:hypothetical protein RV15_GL001301 [Enterococcus silesiacus]